MKKAFVLVWIVMISLVVIANTGAKIEMRNGDVIECEINMESISFITDYGELKIPVTFVREIVFPAPGNRVTTLNTVFPNETFGGFLLDEYISISLLGNPMRLHKDAISEITAYNNSQIISKEVVQANLKTGDQFYGEMLSTGVKIQTSYGEFNISTKDIEGMEFEGEGNVLTKIRLKNSSEMRGTIKDDFIVFRLLSGSELGVSPGKIKSIVFFQENTTGELVFTQVVTTGNLQNMVLVEKGSFMMGARDEIPGHKVTFTYNFYIGKYETTFDEYDAFCEATGRSKPEDGGWGGRGTRPVIYVKWWDAIAYCNWLSEKEKLPKAYDDNGNFLDKDGNITIDPSMVLGYRLPTEAEWEFAARGGNKSKGYIYSGSENVRDVACYETSKPQEIGKKAPNELGIYDMSGNVEEWCSDLYGDYYSSAQTNQYYNYGYSESYRVLRGGNWKYTQYYSRVATRQWGLPKNSWCTVGFRICRTVPGGEPVTTDNLQNMVLVEKGRFTIGDTWGDGDDNEKPVHQVTLTYDFYIGKYETTFDEYYAFCNATVRHKPYSEGWGTGQRPVINVSWWDAIAYCNWLSEKEKLPKAYDSKGNLLDKNGDITTDPSKVVGYRLPTEAEWEYAARGGNKSRGYKYSGSDSVSDVAWYGSNSGSKTHEVGTKAPNDLGIHDMSGNVEEWCSDLYGDYYSSAQTNQYNSTAGSNRVLRGGCWRHIATRVRVAYRDYGSPTYTLYNLGFRIARTAP